MATFQIVDQFYEDLAHKVHDLESDQLTVALCAAANAPVVGNSVLADLTQISYTNLSTRNIVTVSSGQTNGLYKLILTDLELTASGAVAAFRYGVVFNNTPSSPLDPLIGFYDNGSEVTLANGEKFTFDFSAANGALQLKAPA